MIIWSVEDKDERHQIFIHSSWVERNWKLHVKTKDKNKTEKSPPDQLVVSVGHSCPSETKLSCPESLNKRLIVFSIFSETSMSLFNIGTFLVWIAVLMVTGKIILCRKRGKLEIIKKYYIWNKFLNQSYHII